MKLNKEAAKEYKSHMFVALCITTLNKVPPAQNKVSVSGFAEISTLGAAAVWP